MRSAPGHSTLALILRPHDFAGPFPVRCSSENPLRSCPHPRGVLLRLPFLFCVNFGRSFLLIGRFILGLLSLCGCPSGVSFPLLFIFSVLCNHPFSSPPFHSCVVMFPALHWVSPLAIAGSIALWSPLNYAILICGLEFTRCPLGCTLPWRLSCRPPIRLTLAHLHLSIRRPHRPLPFPPLWPAHPFDLRLFLSFRLSSLLLPSSRPS